MIRLLWRFSLLVLLALAFAWLADRPGSVTLRWLGREVEMSVVVAVTIAVVALATLLFVWNMLRSLWRSPTAAREFWRFRKHRKGYEALSKGIIAAGAGDAQSASRHAATAGNALSDEPLVNVLAAQAAQLKGDKDDVRRIFESMAASPETEVFGLRGLFVEARNTGDLVAALKHAEKALALNPRLPWASTAVLQVQTARKSWAAAALTLDQQGRNGLLAKDQAGRKRAAMLVAEALAIENTDAAKAMDLASKALDLDAALVPAASLVARQHIAAGSTRRAMKVLRAAWAAHPHPDLADLIAHAVPSDTAEAAFERLRDTVGKPEDNIENAVALARFAIAARRVDVARQALSSAVETMPQARVCALMAQIEELADDKGRVREWLARALHAPRDPMWVSDGVANQRWVPVSPVTGDIVRCEWKQPFDMAPAPAPLLSTAAQPADVPSQTLLPVQSPADHPSMAKPPAADDPGITDREED
jgi:HemY protein